VAVEIARWPVSSVVRESESAADFDEV